MSLLVAQEEHLENLDIRSRLEELGHIDLNNLQGHDCADILEGGATQHLINILIENDEQDSPKQLTSSILARPKKIPQRIQTKVDVEYDPVHHYPPNLGIQLFGGTQDDGELPTRFAAWCRLVSLPECQEIPKTNFDSLYYPGDTPTDDMSCPYENCTKKDLRERYISTSATRPRGRNLQMLDLN
ncbi:hypothetical protein PAXINDRAFT_19351 [Paxillus involutus ATCC 200175]|uniref:Uncharacterized protein n=1 Tax=Paxillus involutus ATCC 200175 TaxID=664439 RepID=A0A0C9TJE2_PAXIN|nr:hypothetical protein PAXINDRAFT_19351 [Paxillus involutus ATCC 200175]